MSNFDSHTILHDLDMQNIVPNTVPINLDLTSYIKIFDNVLSLEECKNIINKISNLSWQQHQYFDYKLNKCFTSSKELSITYSTDPEIEYLNSILWSVIQNYFQILNYPWFDKWHGYTQIRFNKYDINTNMKSHCDHIQSMFDGNRKGIPILSIVGMLNDNFSGGEFVMFDSIPIFIPPGSVVIFPSNFMFPHKVNTVTEGTRYSYVSWVW